ncbi:MAG: hypothetical protein V4725_07580 [Bacteroidota bacterium]|nr:hypothetical protein [Ferruginibacter sp.]
MKKYIPQLSLLVVIVFLLQGCVKDKLQTTYTYFEPVFKSKTEVQQSVKSSQPVALKNTGKIFIHGNYIFINEMNKGVHIIDNSNPSSPRNLSFISIPGNVDIAVKNTTLYADIYTDMLAIDISDPTNAVLKKVTSNVFPERAYEMGAAPDSSKYVVDWVKKQTTDRRVLESKNVFEQSGMLFSSQPNAVASSAPTKAVGGSMARFTIVNDHLYTVGRSSLTSFNISSSFEPVQESIRNLGWNIETIYPLKDKLFIGSQTGMFIYSIADPANPAALGTFSHACFNDPVIADDQYAYVTLRSTENTTNCWGVAAVQRNELDIVNIQNILQPRLTKIYDMAEPKGLSKDGKHLWICDGKAGLKIYDASNVEDLKLLKVFKDINPFDVICLGSIAIVVANEGFYQYDYTNINNIKLVSKIAIDK